MPCTATRVAQSLRVSLPCAGAWRMGMFYMVSLEAIATALSWAGWSSHLGCGLVSRHPSLFCMFREGPSSAMGCAEGTKMCGKICSMQAGILPCETLPRLPGVGLPQQWGAACSGTLWIWKGHKIDFTLQITQFIILSAEAACEIQVLGPHTFTYVRHLVHKMLGVICRLHWQILLFFTHWNISIIWKIG